VSEIKSDDIKNICYNISKKIILPKFCNLKEFDLKRKSNNDLVTSVDIEVEKQLEISLKKLIPSSLFIGEELFENNNSILDYYHEKNYCWTVDPIDGTTNYSKGKEKFAIMIGLSFRDKILQSWIYKPLDELMCYAINGEGSFINDIKIKSNSITELNKCKGSISKKYWSDYNSIIMHSIISKFENVSSYGCIGFEYIDIANGNRDFTILSKLSPWDHLPGILIAREAGGIDTYFDDGQYNFLLSHKKNLIVSGNKVLTDKIFNLIIGE